MLLVIADIARNTRETQGWYKLNSLAIAIDYKEILLTSIFPSSNNTNYLLNIVD